MSFESIVFTIISSEDPVAAQMASIRAMLNEGLDAAERGENPPGSGAQDIKVRLLHEDEGGLRRYFDVEVRTQLADVGELPKAAVQIYDQVIKEWMAENAKRIETVREKGVEPDQERAAGMGRQ